MITLGQNCTTNNSNTNPQSPVDLRGQPYINEITSGTPKLDWTAQNYLRVYEDPPTSGNWTNGSIINPFYDANNNNLQHLINTNFPELQDNKPEDGWELINFSMGQQFDTDASGALTIQNETEFHPKLILYNKFTGVLRVFVFFDKSLVNSDYETAVIRLQPDYDNITNQDNVPALFQHIDGVIKPLADFERHERGLSVVNNVEIAAGEWIYADFAMSYDPCVCFYDYIKLYVDVDVINSSTIDLGGSITLDGYVDVSNKKGDVDNSNFIQSVLKSGKKGQTANKSVKGFNEMLEKSSKNLGVKALKVKQFKKFTETVVTAGTVAVPYVGIAIGIIDFFVTTGQKKNADDKPSKPTRNPISLQGDITLSGGITDITPGTDYYIEVPGSQNQNSNAIEHIPMYNQPLGVMTMLEAPKIKYATYYAPTNVPFRNSWNQQMSITQFQVDENPEILINPASGLELEELKVSLVLDYKSHDYREEDELVNRYEVKGDWHNKPAIFDSNIMTQTWNGYWPYFSEQASTFNEEKHIDDSLYRLSLGQIPIGCFEESSFYLFNQHSYLFEEALPKIYIRFNATLKRIGEPDAERVKIVQMHHIPVESYMYDQQTLPEPTYEIVTNEENFGYSIKKPSQSGGAIYPEKNSWIKDFLGFSNETIGPGNIYAWTSIVLDENVIILPPFDAHAGELISAYPKNQFNPEIKFKAGSYLDNTCLDPASNFLSTVNLQTYCSSTSKYNPVYSKRDLFSEAIEQEIEYDFNLYPNPTDDLVNVEVALRDGANYTIEMLDLSGRVVYTQTLSSSQFNNSTHQINTSNFESGIYFVNVTEGDNRMTKRLIITR